MPQVELTEAKKHLIDLIETALDGEEVVITQNDQPVLKLVPILALKPRRKAGSAKGLISMSGDFDAPLVIDATSHYERSLLTYTATPKSPY